MQDEGVATWPVAFGLIYFTFFLDNVLLTVLVPIIPDWIRGESLALWAAHDAPLALALNSTVHRFAGREGPGVGASQAAVGLVLSAKALVQLAAAGPAAAAVARLGAARVLRRGTALLLLAALVFTLCSVRGGGGAAAVLAGVGRAAQGAGAALSGVAGLALAAAAVPPLFRDRALGALLGAVALGVLVGYPFGGATYALWSREAPFVIVAAALIANLVLQYMFLDREEFNRSSELEWCGWWGGARAALAEGRGGAAGACAGAVLLTTSVMAALEPCLPLWIMEKFHPQRWVSGAVFVPDSAAYLVAASVVGGAARAAGAERVALCGQVAVGAAALWLPHARSVAALAPPHAALGAGLGALDAALVPALLARAVHRGSAAPRAALLQAAAAAAYALGPLAGGALAWATGFESTLRALGVANLLYAAYLYRALSRDPLSRQWGACTPEGGVTAEEGEGGELVSLHHHRYETFR